MSNSIFVPDNDNSFASNSLRKGIIHYNFKTPKYQVVSYTPRQKLIYKLRTSTDWITERENLPPDEKIESKNLFDKINEIPNESVLKKCLLVLIWRAKYQQLAIGIEVINGNNYVVFKSVKVSEIKTMCKKHKITINYDNKYTFYLFLNAYLNQIIPEEIWIHTALKFFKINKRDKKFSEKLKQSFKF